MLNPKNKTSPFFSSSGVKPETEDKSGTPTVSKPESKTQQNNENKTDELKEKTGESKNPESKTQQSIQDKTTQLQEETAATRKKTQAIYEDLKSRGFNFDSGVAPFSEKEVKSTKINLNEINANAVRGMSESDALKYASQSIGAMESKMAEISNVSANAMNMGGQQNAPTTNTSNNNTVSNNTQNITQITMDYMRNIKTDSEKTPHWRSMMG